MSHATLTSKGRTTIPKIIREQAGLHPGDKMHFTVRSNGAIMVRVKNRNVRKLEGILKSRRKVPISRLSR